MTSFPGRQPSLPDLEFGLDGSGREPPHRISQRERARRATRDRLRGGAILGNPLEPSRRNRVNRQGACSGHRCLSAVTCTARSLSVRQRCRDIGFLFVLRVPARKTASGSVLSIRCLTDASARVQGTAAPPPPSSASVQGGEDAPAAPDARTAEVRAEIRQLVSTVFREEAGCRRGARFRRWAGLDGPKARATGVRASAAWSHREIAS